MAIFNEVYILEFFGKKKNKKPMTKTKVIYKPFTKEECTTIFKIAKDTLAKYPDVKRCCKFGNYNDYMNELIGDEEYDSDIYLFIMTIDMSKHKNFNYNKLNFDECFDVYDYCKQLKNNLYESNIQLKYFEDYDKCEIDISASSRKTS